MDCPTWAIELLTAPLLPMPTPLRAGAIASPAESACAAGIAPRTAANTAAVTMTGRTTDVAPIPTVSHVERPASHFPLVDQAKRPAILLAVMWSSPPLALHAHGAQ